MKVVGEHGTIADEDIPEEVVKGGVWEMVPAPNGKFTVELVLDDQVHTAKFNDKFEVKSEITVRAESWQMISLSALDKSVMKRDDDVSFYWWDEENPIGDYWQYRAFNGGDVDSTRGFWYGTTAGTPLVLREGTGSKDSEIVWELDSLYSGWNLMANPYGWYVDLTKGKTDDGSKVAFWRWNPANSEYEIPTVIGPYEAVWVKAPHATTWRVSAAPVFEINMTEPDRGAPPQKKALRKAGNAHGSFSLVATLADEYGKKDSWNVLGAGSEENLEEPPAGMGDRVSLAIREQGADGKKGVSLAKSIKAIADEYSWSLEASASSARDGLLSFDGVADLRKQGLKLFVTADGNTTEVQDGTPVRVALAKTAKRIDVVVGASNAVVASNKIRGLRSTQLGDQVQVSFDAPESMAGAAASYSVVGVDGKQVASGRFNATAGTNLFAATVPTSGIYFVKIKVGSQGMTGKVFVR